MVEAARAKPAGESGRKEEADMPLYMTQASYTPEAWAALTQNPQDRSEALRGLAESMGGRLLSFHYSFGDYDIVTMQEAPDDKTAAAILVAAVSAGHLKSIKTTPLLTTEDAMEVLRRAGEASYRGPGR
jgi:uncharacterized protein with GYD domain